MSVPPSAGTAALMVAMTQVNDMPTATVRL